MTNLSTQIANELLELTSQLPRVQASMTRDMTKLFKQFQVDMIAEVTKADIMGVTARRYQEKRALALVKSVRKLTTVAYRDIHKTTETQLINLAGVSSDTLVATTNKIAQGELLKKTLSSPQLKHLVKNSAIDGATSAEWWGKQAANTQFKFKSVVQDALLNNEGTDTIVRGIRGTNGFMNTSYNNARSLVHTSVQNVANQSRLDTMAENDDVIEGVEWLSTLDGHTTQICKTLDGLVWDNERNPVGHSQPWVGATAHWQCRSTQVPVLKGFSELSKGDQIEFKSVRAGLDGKPISGDINYNEWLKEKDLTDSAFVKATLGAKKYELWRKHDLSMIDMVDQHNNPLTVSQLASKFGAVIKVAPKHVVKNPLTKAHLKKVSTTFVEAKTVKQAEERMLNLGVDKVSLKGLSVKNANAVLSSIEAEHKIAPLTLTEIKMSNSPKADWGAMYSHDRYGRTRKITLNRALIGKGHSAPKPASYQVQIETINSKIFDWENDYLGNSKYSQAKVRAGIRAYKSRILDLTKRIEAGEVPRHWSISSRVTSEADAIRATVTHEVGHHRHHVEMNHLVAGYTKQGSVSEYGRTNAHEYVAEWYAAFRIMGIKPPAELLKHFEAMGN